jgi:glycosyltransferase involved in cell wall biosynthesis
MAQMAKLTVGLIVRNGASTMARALDSLLTQSFRDFVIVIGDNASTDATGEIAAAYAAADSRVTVLRHPQNLGARANFESVLAVAETTYFMWAAADDCWAPDHLARNIALLDDDPACVCSQSRVLFLARAEPSRLSRGTSPLLGSVSKNLRRFLTRPEDNSRFYGIFRTNALKASLTAGHFHAYDWGISARTLRFGTHREVDAILMLRDETPPTAYAQSAAAANATGRFAPMLGLGLDVFRGFPASTAITSLPAMLLLNARLALRFATLRMYARYLEPGDHSTKGRVLRAFLAPGLRERLIQLCGYAPKGLYGPFFSTALPTGPVSSVVITARDALQPILDICAAFAARGIADVEVVVVDRGSQDATGLCLRGSKALRYVETGIDASLAEAFSRGVTAAHARRLFLAEVKTGSEWTKPTIRMLIKFIAGGPIGDEVQTGPWIYAERQDVERVLSRNASADTIDILKSALTASASDNVRTAYQESRWVTKRPFTGHEVMLGR